MSGRIIGLRAARHSLNPSMNSEPRPCHHCGKMVKRNRSTAIRSGKFKAPHLCPHGVPCSASSPIKCINNRSHSCDACRREMHAKEMER